MISLDAFVSLSTDSLFYEFVVIILMSGVSMNPSINYHKERFPINIFFIYVIFYAGQAMYNTYLNLFLTEAGFSMSEIGTLLSAATIVLVLIQPIWGIISDRSKSKNQVIGILLIATALVCMSFYAFKTALWFAMCVMLFTVFFTPSLTLQDNYTLELLEHSKWDFGRIRLGGTLGYAFCAMLVGLVIGNRYANIFWIMAGFFFVTGLLYFLLPQVEGHRKKHEKVKYTVLLKDKALVCMFVFNIVYYLGTSFYSQFYSIYYNKVIGAPSRMVGMLTFVSALSEIPFFWFAYRIERKFGAERVMMFAGIATALRWFLLSFIENQYAVLAVNLLSGCGYVGFSYCLIKYINKVAPKSMRATAQSLNALLGTIFSKIIFTPIGGVLGQHFGVKTILLVCGFIMLFGSILFKATFHKASQNQYEIEESEL